MTFIEMKAEEYRKASAPRLDCVLKQKELDAFIEQSFIDGYEEGEKSKFISEYLNKKIAELEYENEMLKAKLDALNKVRREEAGC